MTESQAIKQIFETLENSIEEFQKEVPLIQRGLMDQLSLELKELQVSNGRILNNVANLKRINNLRNKLERLIISEGYKHRVQRFLESFTALDSLHLEYFSAFNDKFTPPKTLPIIKETAVDRTLNDLMNQGLEVNVIDRIGDILRDNVTTGGSYSALADQLGGSILGSEDGNGLVERYTRTVTVDAINQYSAQYHETIAADLNLNWGRYIGSNIKTTREFCHLLTAKDYVHRSELPEIIEGKIDGVQCKLSPSTGLPLGMIPGTDADNFKVRRGGYNCGHQFYWVAEVAVPKRIRDAYYATPQYAAWKALNPR